MTDARETVEDIEGFMAWHPKKGALLYELATNQICVLHTTQRGCEEYAHVRTGSQFVRGKNRAGWRVRPVKLTFLDDKEG